LIINNDRVSISDMNARSTLNRPCLVCRSFGVSLVLAALAALTPVAAATAADSPSAKSAEPRLGFYLHGVWKYNYPFAVRSWRRADYQNMFHLLRQMGYNTVMLWPAIETAPMPLVEADRQAIAGFRPIIDDARQCGLEAWLVSSPVVALPEIAAKPLFQRSLYAHMKSARLDDPRESEALLRHRAAMLEILNNADGYVTIDGDPGGYAGAKPDDFIRLLLNDRRTLDRVGTHPKTQKVIPWIWAGWGAKGVWKEPIEPFIAASIEAIQQHWAKLEPLELLPGRSHEHHGNKRIVIEQIERAGLLPRSTLCFYEAIEYEPSVPAATLQLADIRNYMKRESATLPRSRGCLGNAQTPILVLPNVYFFARCAADPRYADRPDDDVLADCARFFGGPPELLIPAWSCLQRRLDQLPADLPAQLRAAELTGRAASFVPGGAKRYLGILAEQVDCRRRLLEACSRPATTPEQAAARIADATAALVDWWKLHHYVAAGEGDEPFQWKFSQCDLLRRRAAANVTDRKLVALLAVKHLVERGVLDEPTAKARTAELLKPAKKDR
jgi:hypothetical protein